MTPPPRRYTSTDEDSARWTDFPFRDGDVVVSTRSKHGTTWVQTIGALLVLQTPVLPAPLASMSPWLDWVGEPRDEVVARLERQRHRRIIKTHTPLDGLPLDPRATFIVVARHPLDAAVSLYHQGDNIDRARVQALTGAAAPPGGPRPALHDWLLGWIERRPAPAEALDSLPGVLHHVGDAWARRGAANVVLLHHHDLSEDLPSVMRGLAARLGIVVPEARWTELVDAATFGAMRSRAADLAPDTLGILKDPARFFRSGRAGEGRATLSPSEHERYLAVARDACLPDLFAWLHRP